MRSWFKSVAITLVAFGCGSLVHHGCVRDWADNPLAGFMVLLAGFTVLKITEE